jgi:polyhydroxyalkanoate synthesis regulator phasin
MADAKDEKSKTYDPFEPFREMRDAYLDAMSKTMVEAVNSEAYAKTTGAMLDWSLTATTPFREALEKSMLQAMQQLSLPSRQEVVSLAERFTNLELRVDDLDAKLDRVLELLAQTPPAGQTESRERPAGKAS